MATEFPDPGIDPDSEPLIQILVNEQWRPFILGACEGLLNRELWDVPDEDWDLLKQRISQLLFLLSNPD